MFMVENKRSRKPALSKCVKRSTHLDSAGFRIVRYFNYVTPMIIKDRLKMKIRMLFK
jgi:hypothetical protein